MLNITTSPAIPFDCLQLMRLVHEVEMKILGNEAIWCIAVMNAIRDNKPARLILDSIKDMATDNYNVVADVLGCKLTDRILTSGAGSNVQTFNKPR